MRIARLKLPAALRGVVLMTTGCALLTFNDALMKSLSVAYPLGETIFVRGLFVTIPVALMVYRSGGWRALRVENLKGQLLWSALLIGTTFLFIAGLRLLPLADAVALTFAGPLIVTALAPWLLGERVGWRRRCAVAVGFAGVLIMLEPGAGGLRWAALLPLGVAFLEATRDIVTRRLVRTESVVSLIAWSTCLLTLCALATAGFGWKPMQAADVGILALAGCLMGMAIFLMTDAFRHAEAAVVSPFRYSSMLWAVLAGIVAFGDWPGPTILAGAGLVVASGLYILHREARRWGD